jgi:hypothetical protein
MLGTYQVTIARWEMGARKIPFLLPLALEAFGNRLTKGADDPEHELSVKVTEVK